MIETPLDVVQELAAIRQQSERGVNILAEAERKAVLLDLEAEKREALAFLEAQGTVADRQAVAKIAAYEAKQQAELARVEVTRVKTKLKHLSEATMAVQTSARMIELQWRTAGVGER